MEDIFYNFVQISYIFLHHWVIVLGIFSRTLWRFSEKFDPIQANLFYHLKVHGEILRDPPLMISETIKLAKWNFAQL